MQLTSGSISQQRRIREDRYTATSAGMGSFSFTYTMSECHAQYNGKQVVEPTTI